MKVAKVVLLVIGFAFVLPGCNTGDVSLADVQKNAKMQQDWLKAHPGREDSHVEQ